MKPQLNHWFAIALVLLLLGCIPETPPSSGPQLPSTPPDQGTASATSIPILSSPTNVPLVDQNQLVDHLKALTGERFNSTEREDARNYLVKTLKDYGWTVSTQVFPGGVNVIAKHPNHSPQSPTVLVVAHYDTVRHSPGADDNMTGVAIALEVAHLLGTRHSNQSLAIALFDQEERGLLGSLAFTGNSANLQNLIGVINLEMLGYTCNTPNCQTYPAGLPITPSRDRGDFLGILGDREHDYLLKAFQLARNENLPPIITVPIPFKGVLTPDVLRSDHAPFWLKNIGAVMIGDTANFRNPHYHQPSDRIHTLDLDFFTRAAQLVVNATTVLLDSKIS